MHSQLKTRYAFLDNHVQTLHLIMSMGTFREHSRYSAFPIGCRVSRFFNTLALLATSHFPATPTLSLGNNFPALYCWYCTCLET